jgi:hypothetical protein
MFFLFGKLDRERAEILLKAVDIGGSGNREDVVSLSQQPSECQSSRGCILLLSDRSDFVNQLEVFGKVLSSV